MRHAMLYRGWSIGIRHWRLEAVGMQHWRGIRARWKLLVSEVIWWSRLHLQNISIESAIRYYQYKVKATVLLECKRSWSSRLLSGVDSKNHSISGSVPHRGPPAGESTLSQTSVSVSDRYL